MGNIGPQYNRPGQPFQPAVNRATPQPASGPVTDGAAGPLSAHLLENSALPLTLPLSALFAVEGALTPAQTVLLLRTLLQLPKELTQLLAMLSQTEGETTQALLKALLSENPQIPLVGLETLLQENGGQAREKLLKLLQNSPMMFSTSGQQLGELLQALGRFSDKGRQASGDSSGMESLHTAISLYLPYYPLQAPQQFTLSAFEPEESAEHKQDAALVVLMQTVTMGSLKVTIETGAGGLPEVIVEHHLDEARQTILEKRIRDSLEAGQLSAAGLLMMAQSGGQASSSVVNGGSAHNAPGVSRQEVSILPGQGVSAVAVLTAHTLIRTVFDLDNDNQTR